MVKKLIEDSVFFTEKKPLYIIPQNNDFQEHQLYKKLLKVFQHDQPHKYVEEYIKNIILKPDGVKDIQKEVFYAMLRTVDNLLERDDIEENIDQNEALEIKAALIRKFPALIFVQGWKVEELSILKDLGVSLTYNCFGQSLLTASRNFNEFQFLITEGCNINSNNEVFGAGTALHIYIANENFQDSISIIQTYGETLDLSIKDIQQKTVLITAAKVRSTEVIKALCELKNIETIINMQDEDGRSALHYAIMLGMEEAVRILLKKGADIYLPDKQGTTPETAVFSPKETIRNVLLSIEIHPDRDEYAPRNSLGMIGETDQDEEILANKSNQEKYKGRGLRFSNVMFSGTSLIDRILSNQNKINNIIQEHKLTLKPQLSAPIAGKTNLAP